MADESPRGRNAAMHAVANIPWLPRKMLLGFIGTAYLK
jgi:hypothetical protein